MPREAKDKCGIFGIASKSGSVSPLIFYGLRALQHRGQESAGIAVHDSARETGPEGTPTAPPRPGRTHTFRGMGLVENVFTPEVLQALDGNVGIGHVRYSTTGASALENAQPFTVTTSHGELALGHNGDIANSKKLREELKAKGWAFQTSSDSEVAVRMIANELSETGNLVRAIRSVMKRLSGAYSFIILFKDRVYAVRDPHAIRPLCIGELADGGFVAASESVALDVVSAKFIRDLEPGEIIEISHEGLKAFPGTAAESTAHCQFEFVYFARADSVMDGKNVHDVRIRLGEILAEEAPARADVVVPVPDSGRTHALGFARKSGIPFMEGLMKNRYIHRTFIMPEQQARDIGVKLKLNPVPSVIKGKRVVLVDDSIVRGTTTRRIVNLLREAGAKEVHLRIGSPPIKSPCYLGVDMPTREQLIASSRNEKEIAAFIGADSLAYLSVEGLVKSIGMDKGDLCLGCLTGEYPVEIPGEKHRLQKTLF